MPSATPPDRPRLSRFRTRMGSWWEWFSGHWLSGGALVVGLVLGAIGLWLLAGAVWDLFELTHSQVMHSAVFGVGALLVVAGLAGFTRGRASLLVWLIAAAWAVAGVAVALIVVTAWTVLGTPAWDPPATLTPQDLDSIATRAFAIVAGLGGVALLVIHYRRQRTTERGEQREIARLFTESFDIASAKLGENSAAVRLAGVHALARLADEAPEGREDLVQMVIDVLCAYLRMPYEAPPKRWIMDLDDEERDIARQVGEPLLEADAPPEEVRACRAEQHAFAGLREVRHTVIRIIGDRLRDEPETRWRGKDEPKNRWRGKDYDFSGVVFDGGDFHGAHFTAGRVSFRGAQFTAGRVDFSGARFRGAELDFTRSQFLGARVDFDQARISAGELDFSHAHLAEGEVSFRDARLSGGRAVFAYSEFEGATVDFADAVVEGGALLFNYAWFKAGTVTFDQATITDGGIGFTRANFRRARVSFDGTAFAGGEARFAPLNFRSEYSKYVDFSRTDFCGGRVTFAEIGNTSTHRATGQPPTGLLHAFRNAPLMTVLLPPDWWEEVESPSGDDGTSGQRSNHTLASRCSPDG